MATVRITSGIRFYVKERLEALYNEQIERKRKELQNLDIVSTCYQYHIPAKYRELAQQLNTDPEGPWLCSVKEITIEMYYSTKDNPKKRVTFDLPCNPPLLMPLRFNSYITKLRLLETMTPYEQAKKICLEIDQITEEQNKLINHIVRGVLVECTTLRQVLAVWPTALDFMPDEVKQKHALKTSKNQPAEQKITVDDEIKVSLMKARLLAGG